MKRRIVILTKSNKKGGYCVAGLDSKTGEWVRLVSDDQQSNGALSKKNMTYPTGYACVPLDVVDVEIVSKQPSAYQPENLLIDSTHPLVRHAKSALSDVLRIHPAETKPYLFGNPNQYLNEEEIRGIGYSLTLVRVSHLVIGRTQNMDGKIKTKASFRYNGEEYLNMSVTDPRMYDVANGQAYETAHIVVSLPDQPYPYGCYYKFIAKIFVDSDR